MAPGGTLEFTATGAMAVEKPSWVQMEKDRKGHYLEMIDALNAYRPGQGNPCDSRRGIVMAALGLLSSSGSLVGAITASKAVAFRITGGIAGLAITVYSLYQDADNAYDFDYGGDSAGWGWGSLGFGSWYDFGGGGGGGGYYDDFAEYEEMLGY